MLKNSFTYLPVLLNNEGQPRWGLVSDYHVAQYLRQKDRKARLGRTLDCARKEDPTLIEPTEPCFENTSVVEALKMSKGKAVIVIDREERLVGIVTPFDFL
jgi:CBS domain-containing protein